MTAAGGFQVLQLVGVGTTPSKENLPKCKAGFVQEARLREFQIEESLEEACL